MGEILTVFIPTKTAPVMAMATAMAITTAMATAIAISSAGISLAVMDMTGRHTGATTGIHADTDAVMTGVTGITRQDAHTAAAIAGTTMASAAHIARIGTIGVHMDRRRVAEGSAMPLSHMAMIPSCPQRSAIQPMLSGSRIRKCRNTMTRTARTDSSRFRCDIGLTVVCQAFISLYSNVLHRNPCMILLLRCR